MTREEKILYHINKSGQGIEIGPSYNPIAPKKDGYRVHIIDHMSQEQLIRKYKDHNVHMENIEAVDFVWRGEPYSILTGKRTYYDWIIASHIIEHAPDLIGFINDCDSIMKDDAVLSLAIPDKRYCFDHFRPITGISGIIDSHFKKNTIHTPGTVAEYCLNVVSKAGQLTWSSGYEGEYNFVHSLESAIEGMELALNTQEYIDVHAWCFTPHSFRLIIHDLYCLKLIPFREVSFFPTEGLEFYITLGRKGKGITLSRLDILKIIESELSI
jgi:predicted SAM-dependent methyltransferase